MKKQTITRDKLIDWGHCYSDRDFEIATEKLFAGKEELSALEILNADNLIFLNPSDTGWILFREEIIGEKNCYLVALFAANSVLPLFENQYPSDTRPREALEKLEGWLEGTVNLSELRIASDAAVKAAWTAGDAAAKAAAWAAVKAASDAAAWAAVKAASDAAAWAAVKATAKAAVKAAVEAASDAAAWAAVKAAVKAAAWAAVKAAVWENIYNYLKTLLIEEANNDNT